MTTATAFSALTGSYTLDPSHSRIGFAARHAMVTKVRGAFNEFTGTAHVDGDDLGRSSVEVTIDAASIDTRNGDRDAHLRSADFLALDEYPEITFRSTSVTVTGEDTFDLAGELTIRGTTRQISIPFTFEGQATDPFGNVRAGFEGAATISRKDFGLTWNAALETGGVLVGDKVNLEFEVSAIRQA